MASMATDTKTSLVPVGHRSPSSWGLGDGQAVPWEYAPAPESRDIVTIKRRYGLFIGGRDVAASDGGTFATVNPATEETLALVAKATPADADKAVRAARRAQTVLSWHTAIAIHNANPQLAIEALIAQLAQQDRAS